MCSNSCVSIKSRIGNDDVRLAQAICVDGIVLDKANKGFMRQRIAYLTIVFIGEAVDPGQAALHAQEVAQIRDGGGETILRHSPT